VTASVMTSMGDTGGGGSHVGWGVAVCVALDETQAVITDRKETSQ